MRDKHLQQTELHIPKRFYRVYGHYPPLHESQERTLVYTSLNIHNINACSSSATCNVYKMNTEVAYSTGNIDLRRPLHEDNMGGVNLRISGEHQRAKCVPLPSVDTDI